MYVPIHIMSNTVCPNCSQLHFAVCKLACFSGNSDPQSSARWKIIHIDKAAERSQTDHSSMTDDRSQNDSVSTTYFLLLMSIINTDCDRCMMLIV